MNAGLHQREEWKENACMFEVKITSDNTSSRRKGRMRRRRGKRGRVG